MLLEKQEQLKLVFPTPNYKEKIEEFKQKMLDAGSSMAGCGSLMQDDFDTWLKKCNDWRNGENLPDGIVEASQYILVRTSDDKLIGMLQLRHLLNEFLLNYGGHIGDCIVIDERKKGFGKKILKLGLEKCKELGILRVLVTCLNSNVASRKCILANGGKYEDTRISDDGSQIERYWIDLEK